MPLADHPKIKEEQRKLLELMNELTKMRADRRLMENFVCLADSVDYFYKRINELVRRVEALEQRLSN